jgi:HD-like signal output (HDOD) protein/signal transduction histidine kinase
MSNTPADRAKQVEMILRQVDRLPTLSPVAARLLEITDVQDANLDEIIPLIETDIALSATVLKLVRSAERGLGDRITSVHQAVVLLGLDTIRSAVLSVEVLDLLQGESEVQELTTETGFDDHGFWKHAVAVACASEILARERTDTVVSPQMAFLAGLLHGVGQLVLHMVLPQAYDRALSLAEQKHASGASVERAILGIDHHTAGRRLADRWGLPDWLRDVIWFHGQPQEGVPESADRELIAVVSLARVWCQRHHLGWSGDFCMPHATEPLAEAAGVRGGRLPELVQVLLERTVERESILGLETETTPEALLKAIARANRRLGVLNATLDVEARAGRRHQALARHTAVFLDRWRSSNSIELTMEQVGRSAMTAFGAPYCAMLWTSSPDRVWRFTEFSRDDQTIVGQTRVLPLSEQSLERVLGSGGGFGISAAAVPWLSPYLDDSVDPGELRLFPLVIDSEVEAVMVHNADLRAWSERTELGPMRSVWGAAVRTAAATECARGLEDELASSNRALAETQDELAQRESLARLGEMTAGAAHEMNNPLAVIRGRAQLLCSRLEDSDLAGCATAIAEAATDLSDLIAELNQLACLEGPKMELSDMSAIVAAAVDRATERGACSSSIEVHLDGGVDPVATDRELLTIALSELVINAFEAGSSEKVRVQVHLGPGDGRMYLRVMDHGRGLSKRARHHAFDPFFSEKPAGRQRGLGLARARRCVELLGGRIWLESNQGGGTVANIAIEHQQVLASAA